MPGDGEVQALLSDVEARGSFADKRGQRHAGRAVQRRHARHPTGIHTHARQLAACQAGGQTVTLASAWKVTSPVVIKPLLR